MSSAYGSAYGHKVVEVTNFAWRQHNLCSVRGCAQRAEFVAAYRYTTGRAGRQTTSQQPRCKEHAEAFAKKHGVKIVFAEKGVDQ